MEDFINETINTKDLPRFEEVEFSKLEDAYWKVILIKILIYFVIISIGFGLLVYFDAVHNNMELGIADFMLAKIIGILLFFLLILGLSRISFKKKGYAFRTYDVLYKSGIIATNTIIIPYNRVQNVALHEGLVSRFFGLSEIQIFTAGASSSDIEIPGINKDEAENIKQLLMGKIQKEL